MPLVNVGFIREADIVCVASGTHQFTGRDVLRFVDQGSFYQPQSAEIIVARLCVDPHAVTMGRDPREAVLFVKCDRPMVFCVYEKFELGDVGRLGLGYHAKYQRIRCSGSMIGGGDKERPDFGAVADPFKPVGAVTAETDQGIACKNPAGGAGVQNFAAFLLIHRFRFFNSHQKAQWKIARAFQAQRMPGKCIVCRQCLIEKVSRGRPLASIAVVLQQGTQHQR